MNTNRKRWIAASALLAYTAILINCIVFKAIPILHIGHLRLKLDGTHTGPANLTPFKTIGTMLFSRAHRLMAVVNLAGNILPFMPVGFLAPLVNRSMKWQKSLILAIAVGLSMESMEVLFRVGIFDVDDILLNACGVMLGYWIFALSTRRTHLA